MAVLNGRRKKFVEEYLRGNSASGAAVAAGYSKGYGSQLLRRSDVKEALGLQEGEGCERNAISRRRVLEELAAIAFSPVGGSLKSSDKFKALELLSRKLEGEGESDTAPDMSGLDDSQLLLLLCELEEDCEP